MQYLSSALVQRGHGQRSILHFSLKDIRAESQRTNRMVRLSIFDCIEIVISFALFTFLDMLLLLQYGGQHWLLP